MIVCMRCHQENPDGRNLCLRCRAYLGWAKGAGPPVPLAEPVPVPQPPPPQPDVQPLLETAAPAARRPPVAPLVAQAPPVVPPVALAPQVATTRQPTAVPRDAPPTPRTPAPRAVVPMNPTSPQPVVLGRVDPIPTVISDTPTRYAPTVPPSREAIGVEQSFRPMRPDETGTEPGIGASGGRVSQSDLNAHGLLPADLDLETAIRCPTCGRVSPAGRRFCRCGATLVPPVSVDTWVDPEEPLAWHRRIRDGLGGGARFWRAMRSANRGVRARFSRARSLRDHAVRWLAVFGITVVGVSQLGPWGGQLRDDAWHRASAVLPWSYTVVRAEMAATDPAVADVPGFEPGNAIDLDRGTAWATSWTQPSPGTASPDTGACSRSDGSSRLVIQFRQPVDISRIRILPGMPAVSPDRHGQNRPKTVDLKLSDGSCGTVDFDDVPDERSVEISGDAITTIDVSIIDVYPADPAPDLRAGALVAVTEVVAESR